MRILPQSWTLYSSLLLNKYCTVRCYCNKVPQFAFIPNKVSKSPTNNNEIDQSTVKYLERLSLVNFGNIEGFKILASSIQFAETLLHKDTSGVEPMFTVLENRTLLLRDDAVTQGRNRKIVMSNAKVTEEEYFVAPPGNIPVESDQIEGQKKNTAKIVNK